LYRQILTSLRLIHITKHLDIEIREQIDFARILYGKGHYSQSLKVLDKAKEQARGAHLDLLNLEIIEFEKQIESRHITRSIDSRADDLIQEAEHRFKVVSNASQLSNLALKLYSLYIKIGHVKSEKDTYYVTGFFRANLPDLKFEELTFYEKIHYYQAQVWYNYILQNFPLHFRYTQKWVDLFDDFPDMKTQDPTLYMRGMHNLLVALFYTSHYERLCAVLEKFEGFLKIHAAEFDTDAEVQAFVYLYTAKINKHFLEGSFTEGQQLVPKLESLLKTYEDHIDSHRELIFKYKIACMYFSAGDNSKAIDYLNDIINYKAGSLVSDIQCYARILNLIAHFELKHYSLLEYLVKSVYRFLGKMDDLNIVQKEILRFLRKEVRTDPKSLHHAFVQLLAKLEKYQDHPYERRSFLYLDIVSWLESKIQNRPVQEVIQEKYKSRKR